MKIIPKYKTGNPIIYTDANTGERFTDMPSGYHVVNGSPQTVNIPEVTVYGHKPGSGNFTSNNKLLEVQDQHDIDTKNIDKLIEEGYNGKQYAKIGGLTLGGAGLALGGVAALPLLAPGTAAGTLIGTTAGGMAMGTTSDLISKYFTGNSFGGNVRSTLQHIGVDLSKMSPIGSTLYELGTDMTNPWYYTTSPIEGGFKLANRIADKQARNTALTEYISPFGYLLFNTYDGKIPEVGRFINGYVLNGRPSPAKPWYVERMKIEPERTLNRQLAFRRYLGVPKASDNLYMQNADGTFSYNPKLIPNKNIQAQRKLFIEAGDGNPSQEILTTTLNGPKGTRSGNAGGLITSIDKKGNFIIDDTWDLNPFKHLSFLPKLIRNFEAGSLVGGKPFRVLDTNIGRMPLLEYIKPELSNLDTWAKKVEQLRIYYNDRFLKEHPDIKEIPKTANIVIKNRFIGSLVSPPKSALDALEFMKNRIAQTADNADGTVHKYMIEESKKTPIFLSRLPINTTGEYYPKKNLILIDSNANHANSTILHELAHTTDDTGIPMSPLYLDLINFVKSNNSYILDNFDSLTLTPPETRALNWQVISKILLDYLRNHPEIKNLRTDPKVVWGFNDYVDALSKDELRSYFNNINDYGDNYRSLSKLSQTKLPSDAAYMKSLKNLKNLLEVKDGIRKENIISNKYIENMFLEGKVNDDKLYDKIKAMIKYGLSSTGVVTEANNLNKKRDTN